MKSWLNTFWYSILSVALTINLLYCPISAFDISVNMNAAVVCSAIVTALFAVLSVLVKRRKHFALCAAAAFAVTAFSLLVSFDILRESAVSFINEVLEKLNAGYKWIHPINFIGEQSGAEYFVVVLAIVLSLVFGLSIFRLKLISPVVVLSIAVVMPCYIVRDTPPNIAAVMIVVAIIFAFAADKLIHRRGIQIGSSALLPSIAVTLCLAVIVPNIIQNTDELADWQEKIISGLPDYSDQIIQINNGFNFDKPVELNTLDSLQLDDNVDLTVYADYDTKGTDGLYLCIRSLSDYSDNSWSEGDSADWDATDLSYIPFASANDHPSGAVKRNIVLNDVANLNYTCYPYYLLNITGFTPVADVKLVRNANYPYSYNFYEISDKKITDIAPELAESEICADYQKLCLEEYTSLPSDTSKGLKEIVDSSEVLSGAEYGSVSQAVPAVKKFFNQLGGVYDTNPGKPDSSVDFAVQFLSEETPHGWCMHYATAAALLLRQLGVPSRFVEGYRTDITEAGKTEEINHKQLHAWAEYYDGEKGWTVLDVTPGTLTHEPEKAETGEENEGEPQTGAKETQPAATIPESVATAPQGDNPEAIQKNPTSPVQNQLNVAHQDENGIITVIVLIVLIVLTAAAAIGLVLLRRFLINARRKKHLTSGKWNKRVIYAFRYIERLMRYAKAYVPEQIADIAEKARFSRLGVDKDECTAMIEFVESLKKELAQNSSGRRKFYYKYIIVLF